MATLTQTSDVSITMEAECCVCAEVVAIKDQTVRSCGHMMCNGCDSSWRSRGTFIKQDCYTKKGEKFSVFASHSLCPLCRAAEPATAYMNRSKESLIHEIQMLAAAVHMKCGGKVDPYTAIDLSSVGNKAPPASRLQNVYGLAHWVREVLEPYVPPVTFVPPVLPVPLIPRPPSTPAPVHRAPRPFGASGPVMVTPAVRIQPAMEGRYITADTCIRRFKRLGCTTARTKLRCPSCHYNLCRSCRGQCPCV